MPFTSCVAAGTNPRMPISRKTKTEQNCSLFLPFDLQLVKTPTLMAVAPYGDKLKTAKRKAGRTV